MCGVVGYVGPLQAADVLMDGLGRLEYRGYDSAGVAICAPDDAGAGMGAANTGGQSPCVPGVSGAGTTLSIRKTVGKLENLRQSLATRPIAGTTGVGHTRWATHGVPNETNAHPHLDCTGKLAVVHNGIIENYAELRAELEAQGHRFISATDTETVPHLIEHYLARAASPLSEESFLQAVAQAAARLEGAYALVITHADFPDMLIAVRKDSPLIIGLGKGENFVASDIPAVLKYTRSVIYLRDGEIARVRRDQVEVFDFSLERREPETAEVDWDLSAAEKGAYEDFMLKEIYEQPRALRDTLHGRMVDGELQLSELVISDEDIRALDRVFIIACGTSYHAGIIAKTLIERWAQLPVEVVASSEFRYGKPLIDAHTLVVAITQSGETTDTMAGVTEAHVRGAKVIGITNVLGSRITREADGILYTVAGPEIGVAATKTFTTQIAALTVLALKLAQIRATLAQAEIEELFAELATVPDLVERTLEQSADSITAAAELFDGVTSSLFLGRGIGVPVAMEGALKLKEISYIHAEAYPAGEMKHGPIALITDQVPVVAVAVQSATHDKVISNVQETCARGAKVLLLGTQGDDALAALADHVILVPVVSELLSPIVAVAPLQLLAYHVTKRHNYNPDMPRNLAKSVTVE